MERPDDRPDDDGTFCSFYTLHAKNLLKQARPLLSNHKRFVLLIMSIFIRNNKACIYNYNRQLT
jgi:hypothetical protein